MRRYQRICFTLFAAIALFGVNFQAQAQTTATTPDSVTIFLSHCSGEARSEHRQLVSIISDATESFTLPPFTCTISFDTTCGALLRIDTKGTMLGKTPLTVDIFPQAVRIRVETETSIDIKSMIFFYLVFKLGDPDSTRTADLTFTEWKFDYGSIVPVLQNGTIQVYPYRLILTCPYPPSSNKRPQVWWNSETDRYEPDPLTITNRYWNYRVDTAKNVVAYLSYDTTALELDSLIQPVQSGSPSNVPPGSYTEVTWKFHAKQREKNAVVQICDSIVADNYQPVVCRHDVFVGSVRTKLEWILEIPDISLDTNSFRYIPNPIPMTIRLRNAGSFPTDTLAVVLNTSPSNILIATDSTQSQSIPIVPDVLQPNEEGIGTLYMYIPPLSLNLSLNLSFSINTSNADRNGYNCTLKIPRMPVASFESLCSVPDTLRYDPKLGRIVPDTFDVSVRLINTGDAPADNLESRFFPLRDIILADSTDSGKRPVSPSLLHPGDTSASLTWKVRIHPNYSTMSSAQFAWIVTGKQPCGEPLQQGNAIFCASSVTGVYPPALSVALHAQDSVLITSTYEKPDKFPVPLSAAITNISNAARRLSTVALEFPSDWRDTEDTFERRITLAESTPAIRKMDTLLAPGDTLCVDWMCFVDHFTSLSAIPFEVVVVDGELNRAFASRNVTVKRLTGFDFKLKSIYNKWPRIEINGVFICNGLRADTCDNTLISITENARSVSGINVWCPSPRIWRPPVSASLVLSAGADELYALQSSASRFISLFDGSWDKASIAFSDIPQAPIVQMTADKSRLESTILSIPPSKHPYLYDAIYNSVCAAIKLGGASCVIVITDGYDAGSARTRNEIVSLARWKYVKIIVHHVRKNYFDEDLYWLAIGTEGSYLGAEFAGESEFIFILRTLAPIPIHQDCQITYINPNCSDGATRHVNVYARSFCGGVDTTIMRSGTFKTFYDSRTLTLLDIGMPSTSVEEDSLVVLPVVLYPPIADDSLRAARSVLKFDTTFLSFEGVRTDSTTILQDSLVQFVQTQDGVEFQTGAKYCSSPSSHMMDLVFRAKGVTDVIYTYFTFVEWNFVHGCYTPRLLTAGMTIFPKRTSSSDDAPQPMTIRLHQNYPNPFTGSTVISYELSSPADVRLSVYDALGRQVRVLVNGNLEAGLHRVEFDTAELPGGVYMYRLEAGKESLTRWMAHVR